MNIAVITPFDSANYGAYLQAYCLKKVLEKMGHTVVHIRTRDENHVRSLYYREKPVSKKDKVFPWKFHRKVEFGKRKLKLFMEDQKQFQVVDAENIKADLYLLGSDEIWNINKDVFRKGIFWGRDMSPVISYAASSAEANLERYEKYPEIVNDLRNLKTALVRDERTLSLVKKYADIPAELVCDPTILLPVSEYGKELEDSYVRENDCLLVYAYYVSPEQKKAICRCAAELKLKTVSCCFWHDWCDYQCECTPLQFSSLIQQSKAVVTTTFHGTVLSILNHANFISIPTSTKTTQILVQIGLESRAMEGQKMNAGDMTAILNGQQINYDKIEGKLQELRKTSLVSLKNAIKQATVDGQNGFSYQICPSDQCTGCFACMNKCPKAAISCVTDVYGRTVPQINPVACIRCGLCKKVCPQLHAVKKTMPILCYAAQRTKEDEKIYSSSGGVGAVLAEQFLSDGDVVYGAAVNAEGNVCHMCAESQEEGKKFRGSKYVQSYIGQSYGDAKRQLESGRSVLFTGTPCQIAGLKAYLGKEYENLYCVDIICHGVPPMKYLSEHISSVTKGKKVNRISFRGGKQDFCLKLKSDEEELYSVDKFHDIYYHTFLKSMIYRENCYQCTYAECKRVGDLTLGDFWGLDRSTLKTDQKGNISVVLVNTEKGQQLFKCVQNKLIFEERKLEESIQGNPQLRRPALPHKCRNIFLKKYENGMDFENAVKETGILKEMLIKNIKRTKGWTALRNTKKRILGRRV